MKERCYVSQTCFEYNVSYVTECMAIVLIAFDESLKRQTIVRSIRDNNNSTVRSSDLILLGCNTFLDKDKLS